MGDESDFDIGSAVDSIGGGLGFDAPDSTGDGVDAIVDGALGSGVDGNTPSDGSNPTETPAAGEGDPAETPAPVDVTAPRTWRPEAAALWAQVPPAVQQEILKREEDIFRGLEAYKADATYGRNIQQVMQPYDNILKQYNIDPVAQVASLMEAHYTLALGTPEQKLGLFQKIAADYGIDLGSLGQEAPYVDPQVLDLRKQVQTLQSNQDRINNERLQQQRATVEAEVHSFMQDPANIYAKELVNDMAALIKRNAVSSIKEAYELAMYQNPAVRAKELTRQQTEAAEAAKKAAEAKVAAARKATSTNVRTKEKSGSAAAATGSMDDTLAAALADIKNRG